MCLLQGATGAATLLSETASNCRRQIPFTLKTMHMKNLILAVLLGLLSANIHAQEALLRLLLMEPSNANGYFILDQNKLQQEGVSKVDVIALVDKVLPGGQMERRTLTQFEIDNGHFARLDPAHRIGLTADETVHYQLIGRSTTGDVIVDVAEIPVGGWAWPAVCRVNCESAGYAWSLTGFSNGAQTFIDLQNGSADGVPFYFYVPDALWFNFKQQNPPSDFGFSTNWNFLEEQAINPTGNQPQWEIVRINGLSGGERMLNGYPVGGNYVGQPGYGIRKDRGPWRRLYTPSGDLAQPSQICMDLRAFYNGDGQVLQAMSTVGVPLLTCSPLPGSLHTGSVSWGSGGPSDCFNEIHPSAYGYNNALWADALLDCYSQSTSTGEPGSGGGLGINGLLDVADIVVSAWHPGSSNEVMRVVPNSRDPRLASAPRTMIEPGLYEFRIRLKNGTILRHFEEVTEQTIMTADFSEFVHINIYPVPVKEKVFAVDFELINPMTINMTVVNNMGVNFYSESVQFDLEGRNKHVVKMAEQWPNGLYHAHFQFPNGSTQGRSFIVDIE